MVITLIGGLALLTLPLAQYPHITPPGVSISINYPGANSQVVADTVAAPIEQQVNGVPGMMYMSSQCGNDGSYTLTVTFDIGTDLKTALVMVQNRVTLAMPQLPTEVQNQGITIRKRTPDLLMIVNLFSPDNRYNDIYLSNYATIHLKDELLRVYGVSDINVQGQRDYSIRAWLDPDKMAAMNLTAPDVAQAIRNQNLDAPSGQIGQPPADDGQAFQPPILTLGRLRTAEQFGNIIVKVGQTMPSSRNESGGGKSRFQAPPSLTTTSTPSTIRRASSGITATGTASTTTDAISQIAIASGTATSTAPLAGGGMSSGGATGNTTNGAGSSGGATLNGGAMAGSSLSGGTIPGLSSNNSASGNLSASRIVSSEVMGRGAGRPDVSIVRLRDVARIELGAQNYNTACLFDGRPAVGLGLYQLPGTNALEVAQRVRKKMEELKSQFPDGVDYAIGYDTTPYISESIRGVFTTLLEAVALVGLVVLLFLQDWRAMILPMIDVPVSIIGTFAIMALMDFSLNNISLFGLVLAIGIVVDDAIVVLENIERMIARGYEPRTATIKAMEEVTGPIVAVGLVLCAVFVPCAFISGITGQFFRQFALTISVSTVISAINAITMTPSRAVFLFKTDPSGHGQAHHREALPWWVFGVAGGIASAWMLPDALNGRLDLYALLGAAEADEAPRWLSATVLALYFTPGALVGGLLGWLIIRPVNFVLGALFRAFNRLFDGMTAIYGWTVARMLRFSVIVLVGYAGLVAVTYWEFRRAPAGFFPQQDQGRLIVNVQLADSTSLQQTKEVLRQVAQITMETPGVNHCVGIAGMSFLLQTNSSNFASMFVILKSFDERRSPQLRDTAIMARLRREWKRQVPDAQVTVYGGSPIPGLGTAGGFKLMIEDRGDLGVAALQDRTDELVKKLKQLPLPGTPPPSTPDGEPVSPALTGVSTQIRAKTPQLFLDIDRAKVASLGVSLNDVNQTLDMYMGSLYVTSYSNFGRHWQVTIQADSPYRDQTNDLNRFKVRNSSGEMVPLGTLVNVREIGGPIAITRYNLYSASNIRGIVLPGISDSQAMKEIDRLALETMPLSMKPDWTELMFLQKRVGNSAMYIFLLSVVSVFLALSALYESWSLPLAVILVVPLCLLSSVVGVRWPQIAAELHVESYFARMGLDITTQRDINIFVQIGLVVLVGLACKNAILVVEYARQLHSEGQPSLQATLTASKLRLRPIIMTSFAFILGVIPLVVAEGAGAEMRRSLGIAVFSGMLGVTLFGIFFTPVFFHVIQNMSEAPLFRRRAVRWVGSITFGSLLGALSGFLLGKLEILLLPWSTLVGACIGVVLVWGVLALHEKINPARVAPRLFAHPVVRRLSSRWRSSVSDGDESL